MNFNHDHSHGIQPRHSTPMKMYGNSGYGETSHVRTSETNSGGMLSLNDLESTTVEKQRQELQLLVGELKDRDKELNEMVAAHQHQLAAWERDRNRVLTLEKRNNKLEGEIKKRHEQIRLLIQRLKVSESQHKSKDNVLETCQVQVKNLEKNMSSTSYEVQDLKEKNLGLNASLTDMSSKVGKLESREEELLSSLRIKEKELLDISNQVSMLSSKLRCLDAELRESQRSEGHLRTEIQDERIRYKQSRQELDDLKADMMQKTNEMLTHRKEILKLKDEIHHFQKEICFREEEIRRKDELIDLQRSKQDRVDKELAALRMIYERQQMDLNVLHKSLEHSQEILQRQEERLNDISDSSLQRKSVSFLDTMVSHDSLDKVEVSGKDGGKVDGTENFESIQGLKTIYPSNEDKFSESSERNSSSGTSVQSVKSGQRKISDIVKNGNSEGTSRKNIKTAALKTENAINEDREVVKSQVNNKDTKVADTFDKNVKLSGQNSLELSGLLDNSDAGSETTIDLLEEAQRSTSSNGIHLDVNEEDHLKGQGIFQSTPTSKLQKLLAESRVMVQNLERTALTPFPRPVSTGAQPDHNTY